MRWQMGVVNRLWRELADEPLEKEKEEELQPCSTHALSICGALLVGPRPTIRREPILHSGADRLAHSSCPRRVGAPPTSGWVGNHQVPYRRQDSTHGEHGEAIPVPRPPAFTFLHLAAR